MKRQLAKKIDKFKLGGTPNLNTVYINNLTKMLNNTVGNNQLSQAEYGMDMQFGDPTKPKKPVQPYYTSDYKKYINRIDAQADSMSLYNKGQQDKNTYINYLNKNGFDDKNHLKTWNTNGWVDTHVHPTIGATYNGILENSGGGFNRDNRGVAHNYTTYPLKNGSSKNVYHESPEGKLLGKRYSVYKKPVQEVIFRANNNTIKKTLTSIPTKVKYVNKKKTITNVNAVPEDEVIPQDEITPLDPMSFPQVARPEQQIIPAPPYVKPVHYAGPRHGAWSDGSTGQFPEGLNTSDWERKTLEYQQQQRGTGVALDQWHLQPATIEGGFKNGGDVESWEDDLDNEQIKAYRKAGYIVKVIK